MMEEKPLSNFLHSIPDEKSHMLKMNSDISITTFLYTLFTNKSLPHFEAQLNDRIEKTPKRKSYK